MATTSRILSERAVRAFERIGDLMLPRDRDLPSFAELGCIEHIDLVVENAPQEDVGALNALLWVLSFFPTPLLRGFVWLVARGPSWPGALGDFFRQLDTGLRSVVVTLYFSGKSGRGYTGKTPLDVIDFHVNPVR